MINDQREVLREFGTVIGDDVTVRVHDSTADMRCLIVPQRPPDADGWTEAQLAELVARDAMIGVAGTTQP